MKTFKNVTKLQCLYCDKDYPITTEGFMLINKHGWGYCKKCHTINQVISQMKRDGYDPTYFMVQHPPAFFKKMKFAPSQ